MDLQTLKYFSIIAQEGSFLGASQKLGYAQSNLSMKIKQLEKELGTILLRRSKQGIALTEKGALLLDYAERLLVLSDEARNVVMGQESKKSRLRLGAMESAAWSFVPKLLSTYHEQEPGIHVTVETASTASLLEKVLHHELDGAFVAGAKRHPRLESVHVQREELALLTDTTVSSVGDFQDILQRPLLVFPYGCSYRQRFEEWLANEGIAPVQLLEFSSLGAILASVSAGLGIALFPRVVMRFFSDSLSLRCHTIPARYAAVDIEFVHFKNSWEDSTMRRFIECISRA